MTKKKPDGRKPPKAGIGRAPGVPNKNTSVLKDAILKAAEMSGRDNKGKDGLVGYLRRLADTEPRSFTVLLRAVLPLQMAGPSGEPLGARRVIIELDDAQRA